MRSLVTHATQLLLAGAFLVLWGLSARRPGWRRWSSWWLAPLAIVALVTYLDFFRFHARGPTHYWEFYHYHLGTKYFRELGYGGLYEATVVADFEDDRGHFDPRAVIRSLTDYQGVYRGQVIRTAEIVTWAFSPSRWQEFKRDVAVYREANPIPWRSSRVQQDHGYNGSPLVTAVLGTLANQPWLSTRHFIAIFSWADVALLLATAAVIAWLVGPASAWLLVFLWALNPLNTYTMIGGAYLRSLHLVGLALALAGMQRGHQPAFGALLAVASLLRLFPGLLAVALLGQDLVSPDRRARLRARRPFYLWLGGVSAVLVMATSAVPSPTGRHPWLEFADKIALHRQKLTINVIGLDYPFFYSNGHNAAAVQRAWRDGRPMDWATEAKATLRERRVSHAIVVAAALAALGLALRGAGDGQALVGGLALAFAVLHLSQYDWAVLALVPLMLPQDNTAPAGLALLFAALGTVRLVPAIAGVIDLQFLVMSLLVGAYLTLVLAAGTVRRFRTGPPTPDF